MAAAPGLPGAPGGGDCSGDSKEGPVLKSQEARRRLIHGILHKEKIHSQEELLKRLEKEGVEVTQATLSRDLKFLSVSRVPDGNGEYVYTVDPPQEPVQDPFIRDDLHREIVDIKFSGNLAVVKTKAGYAEGIAAEIDLLRIQDIIGTLAGDDTVLIVLKEGADRSQFLKELTGE
jgi:transcriptional regulator of arginine metabolism